MIKLLNGHSLTERARFQPESQTLTLNQRQSTARVVIGPTVPEIIVGDWLQDMDEPGEGIVWSVKSIDNQVETKTRTLVLEHVINTLKDKLMFGKVTPKTITGNNSATTCTAQQAVEYILAQQSDWTLGNFGYGDVNPYNFNGDDLLSALNTVSGSLDKCWWSYDTTVYPFVLNMTPRQTAVTVELRAMRNIQTAKITIDKSRMYTRLYPIGKNNLHIDGDYVSKNTDIYGVIEKTETDQSKATKAELLMWANELINTHSEPTVTMTVGVSDLSRETGESLDHIVLGALCRMPLKGYGTVIEEIITQINYPDKIREPETATATLANIQEDVASIINNLIKSGGRGGRASAADAEEDHAWFEDTKDHVAMIAEGIAGEGAAEDWSRIAELLVDGNGIHQRVTQAQGDIQEAYSLIDQTTTAIRLEIGTVASEVRSFIQQTPDMIHAEVGYAVSGFAQSVIEQTATYIRSEVSNAASEISQSVIEQTTEYVQTTVSAVASGVAWSVVTQTMTNIEQKIARKSKVYIQMNDPNDGTNVLYNGDIWIKAESLKTWNDHSSSTWNSQNAKEWRSKYGDKHYVWRDGVWVMTLDTSTMVENEVELEQTKDSLSIVGTALDISGERYNSRLEVTAKAIRSEVSTARSKVYSVIKQTATNIMARVANEVEGLQSSIEVTDQKITTSVSAAKSTLYSTIMQTATNINLSVKNAVSGLQAQINITDQRIDTTVSAAKSTLYSTIMQTATNINLSINTAKSSIYSSIDVEKNRINLVVSGTGGNATIKSASIVTAINNSGSSVIISADHINLNGYVKASQLDANWLSGQIAALNLVTAKKLSLNSGGTITFAGNSTVLTESNTPDIITGLKVVASGNGYKLQALRVGNANWTDLPDSSFSRAVTSWLVGGGSGKVNVTANPQNQMKSVPVSVGGPNSISSNGTYTYKVYYENTDGDDVETGASEEVTVSVHPTKSQIGASRGSRQSSQPSTDASLSGITANGWYVITVSALGTSKTFRIEVDV